MKLVLLTHYSPIKIEEFKGELDELLWRFRQADHGESVTVDLRNKKGRMITFSSLRVSNAFTLEFNLGDGFSRWPKDKTFSLEDALCLIEKFWSEEFDSRSVYECDERESLHRMSDEEIDSIFSKITDRPWWKFW